MSDFRQVMRHVPTSVTVVTTVFDSRPKGFTLSAFASVSAEPPMVLICVNRRSRSHPIVSAAGIFCVNVLALDQRHIAEAFADPAIEDPFEGIALHAGTTGAPVFDDALAHFDCTVAEEHSAGSHTIFIGSVAECAAQSGSPLGYFNGDYRDYGLTI